MRVTERSAPASATAPNSRWDALAAETTVSPGSISAATSAARTASPLSDVPVSSTKVARSASPSWATPRSAPVDSTWARRSPRFSAIGSGSRSGKVGSACALTVWTVQPSSLKNLGLVAQAAPWPGSTTTVRSASAMGSRSIAATTPST
jgi:hypothetical protein